MTAATQPTADVLPGIPALDWTSWDTPFLFFTGKDGVGKTTITSTVAVALADLGRHVVLVSTDPTSNLDDVFQVAVDGAPTPVADAPNLLLNVDPHQTVETYRERGVASDEEIRAAEEQLSGVCTVEIAAFNEFTRLRRGQRDLSHLPRRARPHPLVVPRPQPDPGE